jgi:Holliday junction resolvase
VEKSLPPFLRRTEHTKNLSPSHRRAVKQEKELAKRVGGKRTPASGAGSVKGDVRRKGVLRLEAKTTKHASFTVTLDMIQKIEEAAAMSNELPVIIVEFNDGNGRKLKEVAICPTYVIDQLTEE